MTNNELSEGYSATSGAYAARADIRDGIPGFHRDLSNSPAYRAAYDSALATAQRAADALLTSIEAGISDLKRGNAVDVGSLVVLTDAPGGAIWRVLEIDGDALIESEGGRRFWRPVSRLTVVSGAFRTLNPAALQ